MNLYLLLKVSSLQLTKWSNWNEGWHLLHKRTYLQVEKRTVSAVSNTAFYGNGGNEVLKRMFHYRSLWQRLDWWQMRLEIRVFLLGALFYRTEVFTIRQVFSFLGKTNKLCLQFIYQCKVISKASKKLIWLVNQSMNGDRLILYHPKNICFAL